MLLNRTRICTGATDLYGFFYALPIANPCTSGCSVADRKTDASASPSYRQKNPCEPVAPVQICVLLNGAGL